MYMGTYHYDHIIPQPILDCKHKFRAAPQIIDNILQIWYNIPACPNLWVTERRCKVDGRFLELSRLRPERSGGQPAVFAT